MSGAERPTSRRPRSRTARHAQVEERDVRLCSSIGSRRRCRPGAAGDLDPCSGAHRRPPRRRPDGRRRRGRRSRLGRSQGSTIASPRKRHRRGGTRKVCGGHQKLRLGAPMRARIIETMTYDTKETCALATLGRLTRGALHELANPLVALLGSAELALADAEPGTKIHQLHRADAEHRRRGRRDRARPAELRPAPVAAAGGALRGRRGGRCGGARRARAADTRRRAADKRRCHRGRRPR